MDFRHRAAACGAALFLCFMTYEAARLAYAEHLAGSGSIAGAEQAVRAAPGDARHWLRLADMRAAAGEDPGDALERAAAAAPNDARVWMRAGLQAEVDGDFARAEEHLLKAARLSRQYEPRWTLANYYFRRGNEEEFWRWSRSAVDWAYGDRRPLFRLAWAMTEDADRILGRLCGDDSGVLGSYLDFLLETDRLPAAAGCAARLRRIAGRENRGTLVHFTERMIGARRMDDAFAAWNAMCARGILPYAPLDAAAGRVLTNGGFREAPLGAGFDWRVAQPGGISAVTAERPGLLRVAFTGKQPEACDFLEQFVPVEGGREYELSIEYRTAEMAGETGLAWRVLDGVEGLGASEGWRRGSLRFEVPEGVSWTKVALGYRRVPGTVRIAGTLMVREVGIRRGGERGDGRRETGDRSQKAGGGERRRAGGE